LHGLKSMSRNVSAKRSCHLSPDVLSPYRALLINSTHPSSSLNSGPAIMNTFSFVKDSKYALPTSAPYVVNPFNSPAKIVNLRLLRDTTLEYTLSSGTSVRCPPATNLAL
jgi:hypothetical protein